MFRELRRRVFHAAPSSLKLKRLAAQGPGARLPAWHVAPSRSARVAWHQVDLASIAGWGHRALDPTVTLWPRGRGGGDHGTDLQPRKSVSSRVAWVLGMVASMGSSGRWWHRIDYRLLRASHPGEGGTTTQHTTTTGSPTTTGALTETCDPIPLCSEYDCAEVAPALRTVHPRQRRFTEALASAPAPAAFPRCPCSRSAIPSRWRPSRQG